MGCGTTQVLCRDPRKGFGWVLAWLMPYTAHVGFSSDTVIMLGLHRAQCISQIEPRRPRHTAPAVPAPAPKAAPTQACAGVGADLGFGVWGLGFGV